jgi:hypothetical protein
MKLRNVKKKFNREKELFVSNIETYQENLFDKLSVSSWTYFLSARLRGEKFWQARNVWLDDLNWISWKHNARHLVNLFGLGILWLGNRNAVGQAMVPEPLKVHAVFDKSERKKLIYKIQIGFGKTYQIDEKFLSVQEILDFEPLIFPPSSLGDDISSADILLSASMFGYPNAVRSVLREGKIDVNTQSSSGFTSLMAASLFGHVDSVQTLLESGANLSLKNGNGETASSYAAYGLENLQNPKRPCYSQILSLLAGFQ